MPKNKVGVKMSEELERAIQAAHQAAYDARMLAWAINQTDPEPEARANAGKAYAELCRGEERIRVLLRPEFYLY